MDWLFSLKLIRLFDFYLALAVLVSTVVRVRQYRTILRVVRAVPSRWPQLFVLVRQYRHLFLTWGTVLPLAATLGLWLGHTLFRRLVLSATDDDLRVGRLLELWVALPFVLVAGVAMLGFDLFGAFSVAVIDQTELEKYFDQAEYWLRSWTAPVVRFFTLGYVNPRQMVAVEVQSALLNASQVLNSSLWWMSIQTTLRLLFGLSLWLTYAFSGG
ncbi:MAG: hypothetical protein HYS12_21300 [Planctomycetes bacterium]|nr:hypothetical protein [Planctomycetota bacterium]